MLWVLVKQLLANVACVFAQEREVKLGFGVLDVAKELLLVFAIERRLAAKHLVDDTTESPPIRRFAMAGSL